MSGFVFCFVIITILTTWLLCANGHEIREVTNERGVYKYLTDGYRLSVRPVRIDSDVVDVKVDLYLNILEDLDEVNQALKASGWLFMQWNDFQLEWQPEKFGNITKTRLPVSKLWIPDVSVLNSLDKSMVSPNTDQLAMVKSNGDIIWVPAMNFRTFCPLDLTHFPFDEHECEITVITWTYDEAEVNITTFELRMGTNDVASSEWELIRTENKRTSKLYACCPNPFIDIDFKLVLKRRPTFASHLFIAPSVILCLITPTIFLLPTQSFEKLTLGTGLLFGHVLLLGELINFVPSAHPTIPLMGKFFLANIVMVSLSLALSAVVVNLWNRSKTRCVGPPGFCRTILLHWVVLKVLLVDIDDYDYSDEDGRVGMSSGSGSQQTAGGLDVMSDIAVQGDSTINTDDRARIIDQSARVLAKSDWLRLSVVIDRFFFVFFAVILVVTCLAFSGYL